MELFKILVKFKGGTRSLTYRQHIGEEVELDVVLVFVDELGEREEQDGANYVELKRNREKKRGISDYIGSGGFLRVGQFCVPRIVNYYFWCSFKVRKSIIVLVREGIQFFFQSITKGSQFWESTHH